VTVYSTRATNWPLLLLTVAVAVPLVAMSRASGLGLWLPALVVAATVAVNLLTTSSLRVTVGRQGVIVRFGPFGRPRFGYPLERIARAEAVTLSPWSAAWGILWTARDGLRLTLRSGPALRLTLVSGRRVTINVEDPEQAAAVLAAAAAAG
jgi:hypothetical protein